MKCEEIRNILWERLSGELPAESRLSFDEHLSECPVCSAELDAIKNIKSSLSAPPGFNVKAASARILSKVYDEIEDEDKNQSVLLSFFNFKPLVVVMAAAAVLILMVLTLWPSQTSAISLNTILDEHIACIREGQFKDYECHTEMEFSKKIFRELGVTVTPFNAERHSFVTGDVRKIKKLLVAHALFRVDGSIVSHFHIHGIDVDLLENKNISKVDGEMWRFSSKDHEMIIKKVNEGSYLIFTGKLPFKKLEKFYSKINM